MKPQAALAAVRKELAVKPLSLESFWNEVRAYEN
jgi:hypothetical protein